MAYLTIRIKGEDGHSSHDMSGKRQLLGRNDDADIPIKHDSISREHCVFTIEGEVWYVEDLGSSNGTRVNNDKISTKVALKERDVVKPGKARLTFHEGERGKKKHADDEGIALADDAVGGGANAPTRVAEADDPPEALPCGNCGIWISIAHRLPGDRMSCPECQRMFTVPAITREAAASDAEGAST